MANSSQPKAPVTPYVSGQITTYDQGSKLTFPTYSATGPPSTGPTKLSLARIGPGSFNVELCGICCQYWSLSSYRTPAVIGRRRILEVGHPGI